MAAWLRRTLPLGTLLLLAGCSQPQLAWKRYSQTLKPLSREEAIAELKTNAKVFAHAAGGSVKDGHITSVDDDGISYTFLSQVATPASSPQIKKGENSTEFRQLFTVHDELLTKSVPFGAINHIKMYSNASAPPPLFFQIDAGGHSIYVQGGDAAANFAIASALVSLCRNGTLVAHDGDLTIVSCVTNSPPAAPIPNDPEH